MLQQISRYADLSRQHKGEYHYIEMLGERVEHSGPGQFQAGPPARLRAISRALQFVSRNAESRSGDLAAADGTEPVPPLRGTKKRAGIKFLTAKFVQRPVAASAPRAILLRPSIMKLSNWIRFTWDLTKLPQFEAALPEHYEIGPATTTNTCLALRHGLRIIGAAVISRDAEAEIHLSPGPCISMEYRNRGFGTRLLEQSLTRLREAGLKEAAGIAIEDAPVTKFLYREFNGTPAPHGFTPLLAA